MELTRHIFGDFSIEASRLIGSYGPREISGPGITDEQILNTLEHPIGSRPLSELAQGKKSVLIVTDDNTRATPCRRILPVVMSVLHNAGIKKSDVTILIGLGTHRHMTGKEIEEKFGRQFAESYRIVNHDWDNPEALTSFGECKLGFEIVVNRMVRGADLILSVGSIVPHATVGYSGGGKTIMPGICGEKTIEDTHWKALDFKMAEILGKASNPVREAINSVSREIGLDMIINTVLYNGDHIYGIVAGDLEQAFLEGVRLSAEVYGVSVSGKADVVVAESFPTDIDLRQAIKAICSADLVCRDNGVIIMPADCPEGVAPQFPEFEQYGFTNPDDIYQRVEKGLFNQKLMAYTLVAIGRIISGRVKAILVSNHIDKPSAAHMGFKWAGTMKDALSLADKITGVKSDVIVLKQAGELLPIMNTDRDKVK